MDPTDKGFEGAHAADGHSATALEASLRREREANALLDALSQSAPVGLAFLDRELRFRRINSRLAAMNGLAPEAHIGKRPDELLPHVEGIGEILGLWRRVLATGEQILGFDVRGATPAHPDEMRAWSENFFPVRVGGEIVGLGVLVEDITERKRAEEALTQSEARFRRLIELGPIGIAISEADGRVFLANDAFLQMLGYRRDELDQLNWRERTAPEHLKRDIAAMETLRKGVIPAPIEKEFIRRDGTRVVALVAACYLPGEGERMIAYAVDITARKRAEEALRDNEAQLRQAAEALRRADQRKDEFLATLAHELRNPLAPIRNGVQILRLASAGNPNLQHTTQMMDRQVNHLVRLVDDLLDVSRITRGKVGLRHELLALNQVLSRAVESCSPQFAPSAHHLQVEIPPDPVWVEGDPDRLTQVFSNLLSNAAKFTPLEGTVSLSLSARDGEAIVVVQDTGIGIPGDRLDHVFEMFTQVQPRTNDGLGIGLALVQQIVLMHHGSVVAESEGPGRGSRFTVRLPLHNHGHGDAPSGSETASSPSGERARRRVRVLVVDDNVDAAESLQLLLNSRGHEARIAATGEAAVDCAPVYRPDVVLMDLGLPQMDGITAARLIRAQSQEPAPRIIALTGWGQENDRDRTRQAGFDGHLVKPVSWEALLEALEGREPNTRRREPPGARI